MTDVSGIHVLRSHGLSKTGAPIFFVRPANMCFNRSRRFVGYDKMAKGIVKWFAPEVKYWEIDGYILGSNSEENAVKEWNRVSDKSDKPKIIRELK